MRAHHVLSEAARALERGERIALVTLVGKEGSGPRDLGAMMLVYPDGSKVGTIGGGEFEKHVVREALEAIEEGRPRRAKFALRRENIPEDAKPTNMLCGGVVEVFINVLKPRPRAIIVGGGHVGKPLADVANILGYRVLVVERDEKLASPDRFPYAEKIIVTQDIPGELSKMEYSLEDIAFIVFGEVETDYQSLKMLLAKKFPGHIWVLCSKTRANWMLKRLVDEGVDVASHREKIHMPAGLAINSDTPEEIAVSIWAEAICVQKGCMPPVESLGMRIE